MKPSVLERNNIPSPEILRILIKITVVSIVILLLMVKANKVWGEAVGLQVKKLKFELLLISLDSCSKSLNSFGLHFPLIKMRRLGFHW